MPIFELLPLILGLCVPAMFLLGFAQTMLSRTTFSWRYPQVTGFMALMTSAVLFVWVLIQGTSSSPLTWIHITNVTPIILLTISVIAFVVLRFSENYMQGEPRLQKFCAMLQLTFAAASMVVLSNHLLILLVAWMAVSLFMHQLLLFYPERPRAVMAAHKKFIFARVAELSLLAAFIVLYVQHGTWVISDVMGYYASTESSLNLQENVAMCLIALAVIIKCAQLPVHGWLIQVVEAPTPVSAALHGGVINMGGVVLIIFAPLFALSSAAQWIVLVVAGLTILISALIMMTRISIKVRLAWSTSAQMGLMLVECALGLYELALLHLVAHSFYKAYGFLNSGSAVTQSMQARNSVERPPSVLQWLLAFAIVGLLFVLLVIFTLDQGIQFQGYISLWVLLALSLVMLLAQRNSGLNQINIVTQTLLASFILIAYMTLKYSSYSLLEPASHAYNVWADAWISLIFVVLFVAGYLQRYQLHRKWVQACNLALYSGLYIDEWSTRATLAIWPKALPERANAKKIVSNQQESLL